MTYLTDFTTYEAARCVSTTDGSQTAVVPSLCYLVEQRELGKSEQFTMYWGIIFNISHTSFLLSLIPNARVNQHLHFLIPFHW